jgi:polyhydroxyalkanoate synthase
MSPRQNAEKLLSFNIWMFTALRTGALAGLCIPDMLKHLTPSTWGAELASLMQQLNTLSFAERIAFFQAQAFSDLQQFIKGFSLYLQSPMEPRDDENVPILWQKGSTTLRDYGAKYGLTAADTVVVCVPSLINRGYIFDLMKEASFFAFLVNHKVRPLLVDWGEPGDKEKLFGLDHYATHRLVPLLYEVERLTQKPPIILGYCMGGILVLRALRHYRKARGLALLAVPGNFVGCGRAFQKLLSWMSLLNIQERLWVGKTIPSYWQQIYFQWLDPLGIYRKFCQLAEHVLTPQQFQRFIAVEDWLNDGVPLAGKVFKELTHFKENTASSWQEEHSSIVSAATIAWPKALLAILPSRDKIVPTQTAEALLEYMPAAQVLRPPLGHVGMLVSEKAPSMVWKPFIKWLQAVPHHT